MTQIGGVFSFPLLETMEEVVNTQGWTQPEPGRYRASYPTILTSKISINDTKERFFYVLG